MSSFTKKNKCVSDFIKNFNKQYEEKHRNYENNFWATKMNLAGNSIEEFGRTKNELDAFLGDATTLNQVREYLSLSDLDESSLKILKCFERTFQCYIIEDPAALELKIKIGELENDLARARNQMVLGYTTPGESGVFVPMSSVQLRNLMRTSDDEALRQAAFQGLRSIGPFVADKVKILDLRMSFILIVNFFFPSFFLAGRNCNTSK